jgi:hypothetical protein
MQIEGGRAMRDQKLIALLEHPSSKVRMSALELLASSYCTAPSILQAIFAGWDRFGVAEAYPQFAQLNHLPMHVGLADEVIRRAARMAEGKKLVDPECRAAGKLAEALSLLPGEQLRDFLAPIEELKTRSKIFFRIDSQSLHQRIAMYDASDEAILSVLQSAEESEGSNKAEDLQRVQHALEVLHYRDGSHPLLTRWLSLDPEDGPHRFGKMAIQLASRQALLGHEAGIASWLGVADATDAACACIGLARCRSQQAVDCLTEAFPLQSMAGQLRIANILSRLRLDEAAPAIHQLHAYALSPDVQEALHGAQVLHFDFQQFDQWLESLFVLSDRSIHRLAPQIALAPLLAVDQTERVRRHIDEAIGFRIPHGST